MAKSVFPFSSICFHSCYLVDHGGVQHKQASHMHFGFEFNYLLLHMAMFGNAEEKHRNSVIFVGYIECGYTCCDQLQ